MENFELKVTEGEFGIILRDSVMKQNSVFIKFEDFENIYKIYKKFKTDYVKNFNSEYRSKQMSLIVDKMNECHEILENIKDEESISKIQERIRKYGVQVEELYKNNNA